VAENDIEIKRIGTTDAALLSDVATRAYSGHYLHLWHDGGRWYLQTYFTAARFEEELHDADAWFFLVYYKKEAVGFLKLNIDKPAPNGNQNALELERIYLTESASGKGIGTYLLNFTLDIAKQMAKEVVWLKVMDSSTGPIRFYKKMGFKICGTYLLSFPVMKEAVRGMYIMEKYI
jgi:GNAT superfamily N-acetyltransferase